MRYKSPLISVIIPLYNQQRYINKCIKTVCGQTYTNIEVIVVDVGSKDKSSQIADDWAAKDKRLQVIHKENEGLAYARRDGLRAATGEYITFVDSDDYLPTTAIQTLYKSITENNVDVVLGKIVRKIGPFGKTILWGKYPYGKVISNPELFERYYISFFGENILPVNIAGKLYKKSAIDKAYAQTQLFSSSIRFMGEDEYFNLKLFPHLNSIYVTDKVVYYYRFGGITNNYNKYFIQLFDFSEERLSLLDQYQYTQGYRPLYVEYKNLLFCQVGQMIEYQKGQKDEIIAFLRNELTTRSFVPRMVDFFNENGCYDDEIKLLMDQDYESFYDRVESWVKTKKRTPKHILKCLLKTMHS